MSLTTGRIAIDEAGDIYQLGFTTEAPVIGLTVVQMTAPAAATADIPPGFVPVDYGPLETLYNGERLPSGTWQVESGDVYAGGEVQIRRVIIG